MDISHQGIGLPRTGCDLHIYTPLFVCWPTATVLGSSLRSAAVCFVVSVVSRLNEHPINAEERYPKTGAVGQHTQRGVYICRSQPVRGKPIP